MEATESRKRLSANDTQDSVEKRNAKCYHLKHPQYKMLIVTFLRIAMNRNKKLKALTVSALTFFGKMGLMNCFKQIFAGSDYQALEA